MAKTGKDHPYLSGEWRKEEAREAQKKQRQLQAEVMYLTKLREDSTRELVTPAYGAGGHAMERKTYLASQRANMARAILEISMHN